MYGLPGQSLEMARADIEEAARAGAPHVSAYQLALEPNTVFWSKPPSLPEHDLCADMQLLVEATLSQYAHYETSAFAKPGHRCRHNLNYWEFGDYIGIGAGAHGKISFADRITRHERAKQPAAYLAADAAVANRTVPERELPFEFMLNALRLVEGFPPRLFEERTGLPLAAIERPLNAAESKGLLERDWNFLRPSARGRRFLNDLLDLFLAEEKPGPAAAAAASGRVIPITAERR
jgi:oxygen-independent coproporphyrinogen-3 oxidase